MLNAVAAIFTCGDKVFSIRRQTHLRAFPGYYAFPGGKIDEGDEDYAGSQPLTDEFPAAEIGALIREIDEELGFDLADAMRLQQVKYVSKFGTAVTPALQTQRFNAHFYRVELTQEQTFTLDSGEIEWGEWISMSELWQMYLRGDALMVKPNMYAARALAKDSQVRSTQPFCEVYDEDKIPYLELLNGLGYIPVPSNTLPPATTTNSLLIGDDGAFKVLTDPSAASLVTLRRLKNTLQSRKPDAILLTHHHPDHHEHAPDLARDLQVPILCSEKTHKRLLKSWGERYLDGIEVRYIRQDEVITQWLGHDVICHELPGHDDGMVGLAPENLAWFYVADLVEPGTTVVIPEPEGDMAVYFETVKRVIAMQPRVIIPSHGLPLGGVHLLEKTLLHRETREQQISDLYHQGLREDALIDALYPGLSAQLLPFAHQNVRQHLRKLGLYPAYIEAS
jgi:glyoxylase-like metal-dependent hydrolase (beta-lactamase superfamily II)/8-oxo-dGTP pyrophosphatase MutT (NUDIX family)